MKELTMLSSTETGERGRKYFLLLLWPDYRPIEVNSMNRGVNVNPVST